MKKCCFVVTIVRRRLGLLALFVLVGSSAYAQSAIDWGIATLTICNKGSVVINVVVAIKPDVFLGTILDVNGWARIPPGDCERVYKEGGTWDNGAEHAYIALVLILILSRAVSSKCPILASSPLERRC